MNLPIDLPLKTVSTKVSVKAWDQAHVFAKEYEVRISDVLSACLLHMPPEKLREILQRQAEVLDSLPKVVRGVMRHAPTLSDDEKKLLREALAT